MSSCETLRELIVAQPLGVLDDEESARVDAHLAGCSDCPELQTDVEHALALTVPVVREAGPAGEATWLKIADRLEADAQAAPSPQVAVRVSLSCSFCHSALTKVEAAFCASCLAPHHEDCFATHGRCSALGCGETEVVRPGKASAPRRRGVGRLILTGAGVFGAAAAALSVAAVAFVATSPRKSYRPAPVPADVPPPAVDATPAAPATQPLPDLNGPLKFLFEEGFKRRGAGKLDEAITIFTRVIERKETHAEAYVERGIAYTEKGELEAAFADFKKAIELEPDLASAYWARSEAHHSRGDISSAIRDMERAVELEHNDVRSHVRIGTMRLKDAAGDTRQVRAALGDFERAIRLNPDSAAGWTGCGLAHRRLGDQEAALAAFTRALAIDPFVEDALVSRAELRLERGQTQAAIQDLSAALRRGGENARLLLLRAEARRAVGDYDNAVLDLDRALALDSLLRRDVDLGAYAAERSLSRAVTMRPNSSLLRTLYGEALLRSGQPAPALEALRHVLEQDPTNVDALFLVVRAEFELGHMDEARRDAERLVTLNPSRGAAYAMRARILARDGQHERALADAQRAVELDDEDAGHHALLGGLYGRLGETERALARYTQAIRLDPRVARTYLDRGAIYSLLGRSEQAMVDYMRAVELDPRMELAWLNCGLLAERLGRKGTAANALLNFCRLAPDHVRYPDAVTALERLGVEAPAKAEPTPERTAQTADTPEAIEALLKKTRVGDQLRVYYGFSTVLIRVKRVREDALEASPQLPGSEPPTFEGAIRIPLERLRRVERVAPRSR